jgi:hypothetical protein
MNWENNFFKSDNLFTTVRRQTKLFFFENVKAKDHQRGPECLLKDNNIATGHEGVDWLHVAGSYEHRNSPLGHIRDGEFEYVNNC